MTKLKAHSESASDKTSRKSFVPRAFDPGLATLFATSLGPVKSVREQRPETISLHLPPAKDSVLHPLSGPKNDGPVSKTPHRSQRSVPRAEDNQDNTSPTSESTELLSKKRKRNNDEDDLEARYMDRLGREEARGEMKGHGGRASKRHMQESGIGSTSLHKQDSNLDSDYTLKEEKERPELEIPTHESLVSSGKSVELEKASRTVFLANVSTMAIKSKSAKRTLVDHLKSFLDTLPEQDVAHKVESLRFRSTAFSSSALPKKAAYAKKELMDSTTKSTNAYVVYSTKLAAKEAINRLNGTVILDRHLRVDGVAHPAQIDCRRCVFVGNLSFVDDESMINAAEDEENDRRPRKGKEPADAEEGLWRQFSKAGVVESVRVIRDKTTRVGKGFAYVQFQDENGVEKALLYHEKKFPPMLPRILRVTRAKSIKSSTTHNPRYHHQNGILSQPTGTYQPKLPSEARSLVGRAGKLFGRAGAAQLKHSEHIHHPLPKFHPSAKTPESIVFEGHRASRNLKKEPLRSRGSGRKQGKPGSRSSKRGAAFKASGGKKSKSRQL